MKINIGRFNAINAETYADSQRVYAEGLNKNGRVLVEINDGLLYVYKVNEDGTKTIKRVCSNFDLSII